MTKGPKTDERTTTLKCDKCCPASGAGQQRWPTNKGRKDAREEPGSGFAGEFTRQLPATPLPGTFRRCYTVILHIGLSDKLKFVEQYHGKIGDSIWPVIIMNSSGATEVCYVDPSGLD